MKAASLYVIAYDSPNDRRRTKLHKLLKGFGAWTQYSLFECWLTDTQLVKLHTRLDKLLKESEDSVRIYPLCARCAGEVETIGSPRPQPDAVFMV
jgi:CRISPR-associated protein Cas2